MTDTTSQDPLTAEAAALEADLAGQAAPAQGQPAAAPGAPALPAEDPAELANIELFTTCRDMAGAALPASIVAPWTDDVVKRIAQHWTKLEAKHGWNLLGAIGEWQAELAFFLAVVPPALQSYRAYRVEVAAAQAAASAHQAQVQAWG